MKYKLSIGDVMQVPVKGAIAAASGQVRFDFTLQMRRLGREEYVSVFGPDSTAKVRDFLVAETTDWRGQRLVLDEQGQPATFSPEALECLLDVVGMEWHCTEAYTTAYALAETPEGRRKNS